MVFTAVFFSAVMFFSLRPSGIMTWIGKIINPVFLFLLGVLLATALLHPGAEIGLVEPMDNYCSGAFFHGFAEGYYTMDAMAGLAFGVVVVNAIRSLGVTDDREIAKSTIQSGICAGLLMAFIYVLILVMGAQSRGLFELSENGGIALAQISKHYLGPAGSLVLALTITFACLKTVVGLVTSCSEIFMSMFPRTWNYRVWVILFTLFSFGISNVGLTALIQYSLPVLMLLYPPVIVLIVLALSDPLFRGDRAVYACVTVWAFVSSVFDCIKTLPPNLRSTLHLERMIRVVEKCLPLFDAGFG